MQSRTGFRLLVNLLSYARLRLRARPAMPRRSRSPLVGSGAAVQDALEIAVLKFNVVLPVVFNFVETGSVVMVCVPAEDVYVNSRIA